MARHKSRVRHTRRRRSRTRSKKQAGGGILSMFGFGDEKKEEPSVATGEAPKPAEPAAPNNSLFNRWFGAAEPTNVAETKEQGGGRRKKSRKHHRRHRK